MVKALRISPTEFKKYKNYISLMKKEIETKVVIISLKEKLKL